MRGLRAVMLEVAQSDVPVLLLAEPGAGKRTIAQRIHEISRRSRDHFRVVPCAGFDDAGGDGLLGEGTVFFEDLFELSAAGQAGLLRTLARDVADNDQELKAARLICGSTRDLEGEVRAGRFREDLYFRLSGICLRIPPLRQRRDDIPHLVEHFLEKYGSDFQRSVPVLSAETYRLFQEYSWPGNIRELENAARAIVALGDESAMDGLRAMLLRQDHTRSDGRVSLKKASREASREREREIILRTLTRTRWNRRRAAQDLQISYKALLYKLKQMGCSEYEAS